MQFRMPPTSSSTRPGWDAMDKGTMWQRMKKGHTQQISRGE